MMLQKVNLVLMLIVLVVVAATALQMFVTQRSNALVIQAINTQLVDMESQRKVAERDAGVVYLSGPNRVPRAIEIPPGGPLTLTRLLVSANMTPGSNYNFTIIRGTGENTTRHPYIGQEIVDNPQTDPLLQPSDRIEFVRVREESRPAAGTTRAKSRYEQAKYLPGDWVQVDAQGTVIEDGITMHLLDPDDLTSLFASPQGAITFPFSESKVRIVFSTYPNSAVPWKKSHQAA